jgi:hypothetical protein
MVSRIPRSIRLSPLLPRTRIISLVLALGVAAQAPAQAWAQSGELHAEHWQTWLQAGTQIGLGVGVADAVGWPTGEVAAGIAAGTAAGSVASGLVMWAFGDICEGAGFFECILRAMGASVVVAIVDLGAQVPIIYALVGREEGPPLGTGGRFGWTAGWTFGGLLVHMGVLGLSGTEWYESGAGTAGFWVLGHAILATGLTGLLYAVNSPDEAPSATGQAAPAPVLATFSFAF